MKKWLLHRKFLLGILAVLAVVALFLREYELTIKEPITSWKIEAKADCAIVLTGGSGRVREGFDLLSRKSVKKLIISGVHGSVSLRDLLPVWPLYGDLREEDVVLDRRSGTTYGNAQQTLPIVEALHCRDVALITSEVHMRRAYLTFRAAYPEKIPIYKHSVAAGRGERLFWDISTEVFKSLFYSLWAF